MEPGSRGSRNGIDVRTFATQADACEAAAAEIAAIIETGPAVLGLAAGRTPVGVYDALVARHAKGLSFARVETFNLDEWWPIDLQSPASFHRFMHASLFDRVDLPRGKRHVPNGTIAADRLDAHCREYEAKIAAAGGIDLQLLGIGRNGHVGFNEPGSARDSRTRKVELTASTLEDNAAAFGSVAAVPRHALTMGIGTILAARRLLVLAFGGRKASIVEAMVKGAPGEAVPATLLRGHPKLELYCDAEAAILL